MGSENSGSNEARIQHQHDDDDDRRHAHQKRHGEPALRGVDPHLALNLEALANHIGQIVENLGEVAAGFALQHDGGDEEFHVHQRHALGQVHESIAHRHAEFLFFVELAKFACRPVPPTSLVIISSAVVKACPARTARARVSMASGKSSSNFSKRLLRLNGSVGVGKQEADQQRDPSDLDASPPRA